MKKKALIFYITENSGHFHAATAIANALNSFDKNIEPILVNAFNYTNPFLGNILTRVYLAVIKKKPEIWSNLYDNPEVFEKTRKARMLINKFNMPKIKRLIEKHSPNIIYCTQAFPCGMIAEYKKKYQKDIPLVAVLTDHAPHSYWIFDEVTEYIVPSKKTAASLEQKGVSPEKIKVYGIPISPTFNKTLDKEKILKDYNLSKEHPIILLMGGSHGLGSIEKTVETFIANKEKIYQLLVVTGINKKLYARLLKIAKGNRNIRIFGYINKIEELMEIADIIITKSGGITTSEALAKKLPIIIMDPIPGQERLNAEYLKEEGAAIEVSDSNELYKIIEELFASRAKLENMKNNAARLGMPESALKIAEHFTAGV
ncbi:monogalactosyldiacylglycerol synthase [Candidatus Omnitrophus magneticus]|uniref:Monogalactosyldiacylglycerol synthase n=1 Tax=Candidatus Omnitrophus magneticus TaxID=1609969 RepID=A0A0F0CVW9_9BACT|nr:monogalactosyldiacylglycerol synthase [Candidatus Omnitrophus magneticus]